MNAVVARETYDSFVEDVKPLLERHWRELALFQDDIPLDVNWPAYKAAYEAGQIKAYGVREDGQLIGYAIFQVLERHPHYAHRWAVNDVIWLAPEHRRLGVGRALMAFLEEDLRVGGPIVVHVETKLMHPELAMLLTACGYGIVGPAYAKRLP